MKMFIKESYVYTLPGQYEGQTRWVGCHGEDCGYERNAIDSNYDGVLLRMFKVNGVQMCEKCLDEWRLDISEALEGEGY